MNLKKKLPFQSRMRQTIRCECGHSTNAESEYRSLFIIIDGFNSLNTAIESFFKPELYVLNFL